jgi:hypothetical protein
MGQVTLGFASGGYIPDSFLQCLMLTMPQDQRDFQPFRGIRLSHRPCARQWGSLATGERISWHSSTLLFC